jgi:hypothetical protein
MVIMLCIDIETDNRYGSVGDYCNDNDNDKIGIFFDVYVFQYGCETNLILITLS